MSLKIKIFLQIIQEVASQMRFGKLSDKSVKVGQGVQYSLKTTVLSPSSYRPTAVS